MIDTASTGKTGRARISRQLGKTIAAAGIGLAVGAMALTGPALALDPNACGRGYNTANTAWGTCSGPGDWRVVTWCFNTGSTNSGWWSWPSGTHTQYSSCPSWSHVTKIVVEAR